MWIALQMAASGVTVLQTLTASSALSALRYLTDSAERSLVTDGLSGILAQTLVRRVCSNCKENYEVPASHLRRFGYNAPDPNAMVQLTRGKGCEMCRNTGYRGRIGLFELVTMNAELADRVVLRASVKDLKESVKANSMKELREDGLIKILQGLTTPEEVERAVPIRT